MASRQDIKISILEKKIAALEKSSTSVNTVSAGTTCTCNDIPAGGLKGQVLIKLSDSDYDVAWSEYPLPAPAWELIADSKFSGTGIFDIVSGSIGGTIYWVAVGASGKISYSTDAGATWAASTTITTEDINSVAYDPVNEMFFAGCTNGVTISSANGINWLPGASLTPPTYNQTPLHTISAVYEPDEARWVLLHHAYDGGGGVIYKKLSYSTNMGFNWTTPTQTLYIGNTVTCAKYAIQDSSDTNGRLLVGGDKRVSQLISSSYSSTTQYLSSAETTGTITAIEPFVVTADLGTFPNGLYLANGWSDGKITVNSESVKYHDTVTFSSRIRGIAHSTALDRIVAVGDNGEIGYIDKANYLTADSWTIVDPVFTGTPSIRAIHRNDTDGYFVAVADNGEISRSANGVF